MKKTHFFIFFLFKFIFYIIIHKWDKELRYGYMIIIALLNVFVLSINISSLFYSSEILLDIKNKV